MRKDEFCLKFTESFAKQIPNDLLKNYHIGTGEKDFLWNLFAARLIPCYESDRAREEYDKVKKMNAEEIQFDKSYNCLDIRAQDECTETLSEGHLTSAGIDDSGLVEFYVFDRDFSWVYVVTHELDLCGPYFAYRPFS